MEADAAPHPGSRSRSTATAFPPSHRASSYSSENKPPSVTPPSDRTPRRSDTPSPTPSAVRPPSAQPSRLQARFASSKNPAPETPHGLPACHTVCSPPETPPGDEAEAPSPIPSHHADSGSGSTCPPAACSPAGRSSAQRCDRAATPPQTPAALPASAFRADPSPDGTTHSSAAHSPPCCGASASPPATHRSSRPCTARRPDPLHSAGAARTADPCPVASPRQTGQPQAN